MSSVGLPCEFRNLSGCLREYSFDQVEQWIRHIKDDHLGHRFPGESRCWFCDEQFVARSNRREDKSLAFHMRMYHIAGHLEIGLTAADIRPDFPLLDHLKEYSIIDEETFAWAKNQSEQMPRPRGMTLVSPSGMPPRGEIYPEDRRSRYHRPNGVVRRRRDRDAN
ncbi:ketose-bisphosphate aldolase class-II family protein [Purpureocillium lavendulum]|uniref:Ketose-bisphosphate aldolase class-II family protein n=1 Tax=Purpureocillium lavendulum TaxID=1247861 RepID=A0AB34FNM0_9HYPO|nr:ketose-bisphosphate aldolase class-II family protein [Purpureocillium lavendulum]